MFFPVPFLCQLSRVFQRNAEQEVEMRGKIQDMKKELSSISMMDDFARYARLERKINKMTDQLTTFGKTHRSLCLTMLFHKTGVAQWLSI